MSTAADVLREARERHEARAAAYVPSDYTTANIAFRFRAQKSALTRAINSGDPDKVVLACRKTVREWNEAPFNGHWPDNWSNWQRALDDALGWGHSVRLEDLL